MKVTVTQAYEKAIKVKNMLEYMLDSNTVLNQKDVERVCFGLGEIDFILKGGDCRRGVYKRRTTHV